MKKGYLSEYFKGVAAKKLSSVEVDILTSNQHEFNGVGSLCGILGEPAGKDRRPARFMYLTDSSEEPVIEDGFMTWYDARRKAREERGVTRYEYRLYFPDNAVSQVASAGDLLVVAVLPDNTLLALVVAADSTIAHQIVWLFGLADLDGSGFVVREKLESDRDRIAFTSRLVLESIGVEVIDEGETWLAEMLDKFGACFPKTRDFSGFARSTLTDIHVGDDADSVLMAWVEREETLFRTLERLIISRRLSEGFDDDVEGFIRFSLSVQNRRKSRAGLALENHLEFLFSGLGIRFSRDRFTENRSKPDFLFPGVDAYHDTRFDAVDLTMLGVKSTCKDRWRQVLTEAARIPQKHLLTLEAAISAHQTTEMAASKLQLVVPEGVHGTYSEAQRSWLMNVAEFCELVQKRQPHRRTFFG